MIYEKPKNEIFASDAKDGEIVDFPNIKRGWGVTENLGFIPPMEYFNAAFNRIDKSIAYQLQRGVGEWDKDLEYPIGAVVSLNEVIYVAKSRNTNKTPNENKEIWRVLASEEWSDVTFLKKIDAYTKQESDNKFALKTELTDGLPIGAYLSYPTQKVIPAGFLIADGRTLKKSEYSELFDVIGYTYGGSGDSFNIPKFDDGRFFRSIGGNAAPLGQLQLGSKIVQVGHYVGNTAEDFDETAEKDVTLNTCYASVGGTPTNKVRIRPTNSSVVIIIKAKNVNTPTAGQIDKTILATETKEGITKLKNAITAKQEDAAVTEKAVAEAIEANKSIGVGQTWQDVKDQRQAGVTYTNTTGRPIMVCIQATMNYGTATCPIFVDGIKVGEVWEHHAVSKVDHITFLVPNGSTYKADLTIGINTIYVWSELR
nr:MAG TPA: Baseplate structural protein [Caudoviricetes sp.]